MKFTLIIPARYDSSRLPGKLLKKINRVEILKHVYLRCAKAVSEENIYVSSGDTKILDFCQKNDINFIKSPKNCKTGTDRLIYASNKIKSDFFINVQGDEIFVDPSSIKRVIKETKKNILKKYIINCYTQIKNKKEFLSNNVPKVVFNDNNFLMYMSRAPIPSSKKKIFTKSYKQVCIYGYPRETLKRGLFNKKTKNEIFEDIEILRFLEKGFKIKMIKANGSQIAIDTKEDLQRAKKILEK